MAYMSQEKKANLSPAIKAVLKKYKMKGTISVHNYSTLVLKIKSGPIDLIGNYNKTMGDKTGQYARTSTEMSINQYWYKEHFTGMALEFLNELVPLMFIGNHDRSDSMTDYCDVGWFVNIYVGQWDKPYLLTK